MATYNFLWPVEGMDPDYCQRVEASMKKSLDQVEAQRMLCHEGPAEVSMALGMPTGRNIKAVVVCSCGTPCATIEGQGSEPDEWFFTKLAMP